MPKLSADEMISALDVEKTQPLEQFIAAERRAIERRSADRRRRQVAVAVERRKHRRRREDAVGHGPES
jgi:hypothetical protein